MAPFFCATLYILLTQRCTANITFTNYSLPLQYSIELLPHLHTIYRVVIQCWMHFTNDHVRSHCLTLPFELLGIRARSYKVIVKTSCQKRNFGLKSEGYQFRRRSQGEWGWSIPPHPIGVWESVVSSPSEVRGENGFNAIQIASVDSRWQQILHRFVLKSGVLYHSV